LITHEKRGGINGGQEEESGTMKKYVMDSFAMIAYF